MASALSREPPGGLKWSVLSVPIFLKTLGIGASVAFVYGAVILFLTQKNVTELQRRKLEELSRSECYSLATILEECGAQDLPKKVEKLYARARVATPALAYFTVRALDGRVLADSFVGELPEEHRQARADPPDKGFCFLISPGGRIFQATAPALIAGESALVQVGLKDESLTEDMPSVAGSILWGLGLATVIGILLAFVLSDLLTRPLLLLKKAASRVKAGDYGARAPVSSGDEIGQLAVAFNEMAENLQDSRAQIEKKERARLALLEKVVNAQEDERKRLSRELHDDLGTSLLSVLLSLQSSCSFKGASDSACSRVEDYLREIVDKIHRLAWGMRPSVLDDFGLDSALGRLVEETTLHNGIQIDYHYGKREGAARLHGSIELSLYRVAQEALSNTLKHSGADHASVIVLQAREQASLIVEDNGKGFDTEIRKNDTSLGLLGMEERVALLGGALHIVSSSKGTTLRVVIPMAREAQCVRES